MQLGWIVGYSIYAIILWASLGDSSNGTSCSTLLTTTSDDEDFLILWKVTTACYSLAFLPFNRAHPHDDHFH